MEIWEIRQTPVEWNKQPPVGDNSLVSEFVAVAGRKGAADSSLRSE
jgi:hypothetical protein